MSVIGIQGNLGFEVDEVLIKDEQDYSSTFADNMSLPIHKWFRYTAGFSASWVKDLIIEELKTKKDLRIIDPFVGSGTVVLEGSLNNVEAMGVEAHPYIHKIAQVKLNWHINIESVDNYLIEILNLARTYKGTNYKYPKLIYDCFHEETLLKLSSLKKAWENVDASPELKNMGWFVITSILRTTSHVGTAQWQYVLPNKRKQKFLSPYEAFDIKKDTILKDLLYVQKKHKNNTKSCIIYNEDARKIESVPDKWGNLVITSPPYANNYDYADATRLELSFWGDINSYKDLQNGVRENLIRACTQHVSGTKDIVEQYLESTNLSIIKEDLKKAYKELSEIRLTKGGKKNYHFMIVSYFYDLSLVFQSLRRCTSDDVKICFVIGDSAPYGYYIPVDTWLGELAIAAGFNSYSFEKLRDRNVKWKNRKHTVPLKEGRLWIN